MITGGALLVRSLRECGVQFMAAVCGNGLNPVLEACSRNQMRVVDTRAEDSASYLAEAYSRLTGRIGVVASSSGIAHINAMAGLMNSYFDGSPLLLITGESTSMETDFGKFQEFDHTNIASSLCKYSRRVTRAEDIGFYVHEAIRIATSPRPGPVQLSIPADLTAALLDEDEIPKLPSLDGHVFRGGLPDERSITAAIDVVNSSRKPLIIVGGGVLHSSGSGEQIVALADLIRAPITSLIWDRAIIPDNDFSVGVIGAATGQPDVLAQSDLVILIGGRIDYRMGYGRPPTLSTNAKMIRIDPDSDELRQGMLTDIGLLGDPKLVVQAMLDHPTDKLVSRTDDWLIEARRADTAFRDQWRRPNNDQSDGMTGKHVAEAIAPIIQRDINFLIDGGNIGQWVHQLLIRYYSQGLLTCGASGVVGWGIPGAMAAKIAYPDKPTLLLTGDGAIHFALSDIESAVRQDLPFVVIVADDSAWGIVVTEQRAAYGHDGLPSSRIGPVDYVAIAEGFGARGIRVETAGALRDATIDALNSKVCTLIHIPIAISGPNEH
tara:strand:- start:3898 stop:5544 length:1647 start_codon:yes stop_codon:yes gene_type:complete